MNRNAKIAAGLLAGAGITTTALGAAQAQADELVVRNTDASGNGSFAAALDAANHGRDADKIVFASHLSGAIDVPHDIEVEHPLKIVGNGEDSGAHLQATGRADELDFGARGRSVLKHVGIVGLQVANGNDFDSGALEIHSSTIAGDGEGVGAYLYGYGNASMSIDRSTISGFELGVYAVKLADITIDRSDIVDNEGRGGVAATVYSSLEVTDSTISGNTSRRYGAQGGGVRSGYESTIDLTGTDVTGNTARVGGGIYAYGDIHVRDSTITGNHSDSGGADCGGANVISEGGNAFGDPTDCGT
jgi:hypothetical protein